MDSTGSDSTTYLSSTTCVHKVRNSSICTLHAKSVPCIWFFPNWFAHDSSPEKQASLKVNCQAPASHRLWPVCQNTGFGQPKQPLRWTSSVKTSSTRQVSHRETDKRLRGLSQKNDPWSVRSCAVHVAMLSAWSLSGPKHGTSSGAPGT